MMKNNLWR